MLRNKGLAQVFYDIGWIERWGSGIDKIRRACTLAGLPEPVFEEHQSGFRVRFRTDAYDDESLRKLGLNDRQNQAVRHLTTEGKITNREYRVLNKVSNKTAYEELSKLVQMGILTAEGTGRALHYRLKVMKR